MADSKLSLRTETTTTNGGFVHIVLPDGVGGYDSYKISYTNFVKSLQDQIDALGNALVRHSETGKTTDFTFEVPANGKIESIDMRVVSGSTTVKVGTSVGGTQILSLRTVTSSQDSNNYVGKSFLTATTLYFTITGSAINITITYRENWIES
jgi:hypothetical protein